jgi:hypothetical protein
MALQLPAIAAKHLADFMPLALKSKFEKLCSIK